MGMGGAGMNMQLPQFGLPPMGLPPTAQPTTAGAIGPNTLPVCDGHT
jgi:hypothetical protein